MKLFSYNIYSSVINIYVILNTMPIYTEQRRNFGNKLCLIHEITLFRFLG